MERRVLEEQVHYEAAVDSCVYAVSCTDDFCQTCLVGYHYQCSGLVFRHSPACFGKVVYLVASADVGAFVIYSADPVDDGTASCAVHVSASQLHEEFSDLRLEYHDKGYKADVENGLHDVGHEPHVECGYDDSDYIQRYDGQEDAHGRCAPDPPEYDVYQKRQEKYVKHVREGHLKETENRQYHIPLYISAQR